MSIGTKCKCGALFESNLHLSGSGDPDAHPFEAAEPKQAPAATKKAEIVQAPRSEIVEPSVTESKNPKMQTLGALLAKAKDSFAAVATKHLTPDRLVKLAMVAASRQPQLLDCTPTSILQSVMTAAQLGVDCSGGVAGEAYLVPYRNSKNGKREAQLIVGYRGLLSLARRSGELDTLEAHVVHEKDEFECSFGLEPVLRHKPNLLLEDPGKLLIVYAIARLKDGGRQVEVMTRYQVNAIRARSKASNSGPWATDFEEMARKTVVRRICKYLPMSVELATALDHEDRVEGNLSSFDIVGDGPDPEGAADAAAALAEREAETKGDALLDKVRAATQGGA
jgi:recombination protein RecT